MRKRRALSLREKLAAALSLLLPQADRDVLREQRVTAEQLASLFQFDHNVLHVHGGEDRWWNLTPMLVLSHRSKTKRDRKVIAKTDRLEKSQAEFRARLLAPKGRDEKRPGRWPVRKLRSRPINVRWRRRKPRKARWRVLSDRARST